MPPPEIAPHHFDALALHRHRETKTVGGRLTGHGSNVALRETVEDPYRLRDAIEGSVIDFLYCPALVQCPQTR